MPMRTKLEELLETVKTEYKVSKYLIEEAEEEYKRIRLFEAEIAGMKCAAMDVGKRVRAAEKERDELRAEVADLHAHAAGKPWGEQQQVLTQRVRELEAGLSGMLESLGLCIGEGSTLPALTKACIEGFFIGERDRARRLLSQPPAPQPSSRRPPLPPPSMGLSENVRVLPPEPTYNCARCGTPRTKAEGGTTFTVCDQCWDLPAPPTTTEKRGLDCIYCGADTGGSEDMCVSCCLKRIKEGLEP